MKISNFSISPAMFAPGDEIRIELTLKAEKSDAIGAGGLVVWMSIPDMGQVILWRDAAFTIARGQTKSVSGKTTAALGSISPARGTQLSSFSVQLGTYGESEDVSFPVTLLDARYRPAITAFYAERARGEVPDDEGENILAAIHLRAGARAQAGAMALALSCRDIAQPENAFDIDLTHLAPAALLGEIQQAIGQTFDKNADWRLTLSFGDAYESAAVSLTLARSFANVHLSGASTGGVCFGSFSKATEGNPLFQCWYPAEFEGGIRGVTSYQPGETDTGGRWLDGKRIHRFTWQGTTTLDGQQAIICALPCAPETVISLRAMFKRSDGAWLPVPNTYRTSLEYCANIRTDADGNILLGLGSEYNGAKDVIIICEYTKIEEAIS